MKPTNHNSSNEPPGLSPGDIYFILFRHKWKIILLTLLGIGAAAAYWWYFPPPFQSHAKLFVRYVLDNRAMPDSKATQMTSPDEMGQNVMNSEVEILSSYDVAQQVAKDVGPEKILAAYGGGNNPARAAAIVKKNLAVDAPRQSSVINLTYNDPDPAVVQPVLADVVSVYLDKHLQVHQSSMSDDFLAQETAQLRSQIDQTEDDLRAAKAGAGIISVADAEKAYTEQIAGLQNQLFEAQADLGAELGAEKAMPQPTNTVAAIPVAPEVPPSRADEYQRICAHLDYLQSRQNDYFSKFGFTDENRLVQETRLQIAQTQLLKRNLERQYPGLIGTYDSTAGSNNSAGGPSGGSPDLRPLSLQSRIAVLKQELGELQSEATRVDTAETRIADLERKKHMLEENYQYFENSLQQARIEEALGPGRVSNISAIETPTPPAKAISKRVKIMSAMIGGGIFLGIAWAFFIEFYLDTSVRRSKEIETHLKHPLLISIPDISRNGHRKMLQERPFQPPDGVEFTAENVVSWETASCLNPFYDALRDRLLNYFEGAGVDRAKLVAVTGTERGCGVSAIAAGVATSFSETGERILLIDMKSDSGVAQQFFMGRASCQLSDAMDPATRHNALVQPNLYVVTAGSPDEKFQRMFSRHFASLVPQLHASDFSYVIFDMPPVTQTSIASRLAGFMDMMLLIIQAEKTGRGAAQEAVDLLAQSKTKIGIVLNKTRQYIPHRLHREMLSEY